MAPMAGPHFRYSRWDGTQVGFELGADDVFSEITDDLLYHGDLNAALRRMHAVRVPRPQRRAHPGHPGDAREAAPQAQGRARAATTSAASTTTSPQELRDVIDMERAGLDELAREARESGDARRQEITDEVVAGAQPAASTCCRPTWPAR